MTWDPYSNFLGICQDSTLGQAFWPLLCWTTLSMAMVADWSVAVWRTNYLGTSPWVSRDTCHRDYGSFGTGYPTRMELPSWGDAPGRLSWLGLVHAWGFLCVPTSPQQPTPTQTLLVFDLHYLGLLDLPALQLSDPPCYIAYHMRIKRKEIKKNLHSWCFASRKSLFSWPYMSHF